jgi:hypothetical protein
MIFFNLNTNYELGSMLDAGKYTIIYIVSLHLITVEGTEKSLLMPKG